VKINGFTHLAVNKIDVLADVPLKICTNYKIDGKIITDYPSDNESLKRCEPVYEEAEGFEEELHDIREFSELPEAVQNYMAFGGKLNDSFQKSDR